MFRPCRTSATTCTTSSAAVRASCAPRRRRRRRSLLACNPFRQKLLGFFQLGPALSTEVVPCAIDVERQHPHARAWSFGRDLLRRQTPRNRGCALVEQPFGRIGGRGLDRRRPFLPL